MQRVLRAAARHIDVAKVVQRCRLAGAVTSLDALGQNGAKALFGIVEVAKGPMVRPELVQGANLFVAVAAGSCVGERVVNRDSRFVAAQQARF